MLIPLFHTFTIVIVTIIHVYAATYSLFYMPSENKYFCASKILFLLFTRKPVHCGNPNLGISKDCSRGPVHNIKLSHNNQIGTKLIN